MKKVFNEKSLENSNLGSFFKAVFLTKVAIIVKLFDMENTTTGKELCPLELKTRQIEV